MVDVTDYVKRTCVRCKRADRCHPHKLSSPCTFCGFTENILNSYQSNCLDIYLNNQKDCLKYKLTVKDIL